MSASRLISAKAYEKRKQAMRDMREEFCRNHGWAVPIPEEFLPKFKDGTPRPWHPNLKWLTPTQMSQPPALIYIEALRETERQTGMSILPLATFVQPNRHKDIRQQQGSSSSADVGQQVADPSQQADPGTTTTGAYTPLPPFAYLKTRRPPDADAQRSPPGPDILSYHAYGTSSKSSYDNDTYDNPNWHSGWESWDSSWWGGQSLGLGQSLRV